MLTKDVRQKIQTLRLAGNTYTEIQQTLGFRIPKPTLSYWCKDIKMKESYNRRVRKANINHLKKIRKMAIVTLREKQEKRRSDLVEKNVPLLGCINEQTKKIMLCILYLAEGGKYESSRMLSLGSSDPKIIRFYLTLLKSCYNIQSSKFRVRIQCRFDQNKIKLERFWKNITKIKPTQFYPTYVDQRTKEKPTKKKNYMGVCTIHYFNTEIQLELGLVAKEIINKVLGP